MFSMSVSCSGNSPDVGITLILVLPFAEGNGAGLNSPYSSIFVIIRLSFSQKEDENFIKNFTGCFIWIIFLLGV